MSDRYPPEARSGAHLFQDLAEALAHRGHEVTVFTKMPKDPIATTQYIGPPPANEIVNGVMIKRLGGLFSSRAPIIFRALDQLYVALKFLATALLKARPDVVVTYSPPLPLALTAALLRLTRGIPFVLNLHDLYPRTAIELGVLKNRFLIMSARLLESIAYRFAACFSVPAPGSAAYLINERKIPKDRVSLIYNWINTDQVVPGPLENSLRQEHGLSHKFILSYGGVMGYAQDFSSILACARELQADSQLVFVLVGEGTLLSRWKHEARELRNVIFLPSMQRDAYATLLQASDVCLVPLSKSLNSPAIPGKLQSIMAARRPALGIVPENSDAAWMIRESGCGLVVEPDDKDALLSAIQSLRQDAAHRSQLATAGYDFAMANFKRDCAAERFEKLLLLANS